VPFPGELALAGGADHPEAAVNRPWMQLFVGDWLKHPGLRSCSAQARALAIDLLCLMHQGEPYGHLRVGRKDLGATELARIVGDPEAQLEGRLKELLEAGVFDRTPEGRIYSPRMVRDEEKRFRFKEHGAKGGNPALTERVNPADNPRPNPVDNPSHARARSEVQRSESKLFAAGEPRRGSARSTEDTLQHAEAIRIWCRIFEKETGQPYAFGGAADGKQVRRLLEFPAFSFEELERRATRFLRDPFWADRGVDLKRFASQWTALGNAGRKVDAAADGTEQPSEEEREWMRRALKDPNPISQDEARKRLRRWNIAEADLLGESA